MWSTWGPSECSAGIAPRLFHTADIDAITALDAKGKVAPAGINWRSITANEKFGVDDKCLHLSLMPIPYLGNLREAKVIVLMQNPGLSPGDYYAECEIKGFRDRLLENLKGDGCAGEFPFLFLDPSYSWHGGFSWWQRKLKGVIAAVAVELGLGEDLRTARKHVAKHLAAIELLPYHSQSGVVSPAELGAFQSVAWARAFVRHQILNYGTNIVVARHAAAWGLRDLAGKMDHCVVYEPKSARAASLNPETEGGRLIVDAIVKAVRE